MGLLSEARKQEIANLKAAKKEKKAERGYGMIGMEGLDLITLGLVEDVDKIPKFELTVEDGRKLAKEYSRVMMRKHRARQKAESEFLECKKAAIEALPEHLRAAAMEPDYTPVSANRFMATLTPPIEGYMEKINEAGKNTVTKAKLR